MNQTIQLIATCAVSAGVIGSAAALFPYLKSKGMNVSLLLDNAQKATDSFDKVLDVVQTILPNNPAVGVLTIIEKWAKIGVGNAEQLYHSGEVTSDERVVIASQTVYNVLSEMSIAVDDNKKTLIDAAIKEAVWGLGHTKEAVVKTVEAPVEKTDETTTSNTALTDALTQIQTILAAVQPATTTDATDTEAQKQAVASGV